MHKRWESLRPCRQRGIWLGKTFADELAMHYGYGNIKRCSVVFSAAWYQPLPLSRLLNAISGITPRLKESILAYLVGPSQVPSISIHSQYWDTILHGI